MKFYANQNAKPPELAGWNTNTWAMSGDALLAHGSGPRAQKQFLEASTERIELRLREYIEERGMPTDLDLVLLDYEAPFFPGRIASLAPTLRVRVLDGYVRRSLVLRRVLPDVKNWVWFGLSSPDLYGRNTRQYRANLWSTQLLIDHAAYSPKHGDLIGPVIYGREDGKYDPKGMVARVLFDFPHAVPVFNTKQLPSQERLPKTFWDSVEDLLEGRPFIVWEGHHSPETAAYLEEVFGCRPL